MPIDNLVYKYALNTNQLIKVTDIDGNTSGFKDGVDATTEYYYDSNGNLGRDDNKGITGIIYNHLNLPMKISFGTNTIEYVYNALGEKLKKTVVDNGVTTTTDYLDGYQYLDGSLKQFATNEGYVSVSSYVFGGVTTISNSYIFNYTDHLGNVRLSYAPYDDTLAIFEENNYYPFGMKHKNYNVSKLQYDNSGGMINVVTCLVCDYNYKYNGQEWQDELGLNMYDMEYRDYDPAIARWVVMDPVIHHNLSPYNAFDNDPVFWADPSGANSGDNQWLRGFDGVWHHVDGSNFTEIYNSEGSSGDDAEEYADSSRGDGTEGGGDPKKNDGAKFRAKITNTAEILSRINELLDPTVLKNFQKSYFEDNTIKWFSHGSKNGIAGGMSAGEFSDYLYARSPLFKQAVDNNSPLTLKLYACYTGEYEGFANDFSTLHPNLTIYAPNYTITMSCDPMYIGDPGGRHFGQFNIYNNGNVIGSANFKN